MNNVFFVLCCLTSISVAQDFSKQWSYAESVNDENLQADLITVWEYYHQSPINLNNSNEINQLNDLQLLSKTELKRIKTYCHSRQLISIYELQGLDVNVESLKRIKDFICVKNKYDTKTRPKKSNLYYGMQFHTPLKVGILQKKYVGSPFKTHLRYRTHLKRGWSFGLNWEKDPGEPLWYEDEGINNFAISIRFQGKNKLKKVLFGKYDINLGEGLLFGTSYRINNPYFLSYKPVVITKGCLSSKEYNYFEGISTQWKLKNTWMDVFISRRKLNGKSSIDKTGLFKTAEEIENRKTFRENLFGVSISSQNPLKKISWAGMIYQSDYLNSKTNFFQSLYVSKNYYNVDYAGEIALQNLNKWALLQKLTLSVSNRSLFSLQFRSRNDSVFNEYKSDYSSFSNGYENGFLWCFQHDFDKKWQFRATFDHFKSNFIKKGNTNSTSGRRLYSEISRRTEQGKFVLQYQHKILSDSEKLNKFKLYYLEHLTSNLKLTVKGNYINDCGQNNSALQSNFYHTSNNELEKISISYCVFNTKNESI